jgi:hypothetical protein
VVIQRYRMEGDVEHHAMSGHCGEAVAKAVEDPAGQWVKVEDIEALKAENEALRTALRGTHNRLQALAAVLGP